MPRLRFSLAIVAVFLLPVVSVAQAQQTQGTRAAGSWNQDAQSTGGSATSTGGSAQTAPGGGDQAATGGASAQARQMFLRGQSAYQQGDYDTAIQQWKAAYRLDARPLILYNLSQAYEHLGRAQDAVHALEHYIDTADPSNPYMADARARLAALRERVAHTGVRISGGPEGATITIDGHAWGLTPRPDPVPVQPGSHQLVIKHAGDEDFRSSVSVPAGQVIDVQVQMVHAQTAPVAAPGRSPWPYVLMGAGGAFAIVALIVGGIASGAADAAPTRDGAQAEGARGAAHAADGIGVTSLLMIAGGFVWWLLDAPAAPAHHDTATASLRLAPYVSPEGGGAVAVGRF